MSYCLLLDFLLNLQKCCLFWQLVMRGYSVVEVLFLSAVFLQLFAVYIVLMYVDNKIIKVKRHLKCNQQICSLTSTTPFRLYYMRISQSHYGWFCMILFRKGRPKKTTIHGGEGMMMVKKCHDGQNQLLFCFFCFVLLCFFFFL